ncbi:YcnI family protein [Paenibacillus solisilvae]|uniref:YcnI family protein n=1 Tax=Paenibacillus solisilvae TaxID=2486751 RepID=A0ABW0VTM1_9BACL
MNHMKKWSMMCMTALSLFMFAGIASAHVTVQPTETTQGSYEVFTVRVPSESENVSTTSVKVTVPGNVKVSRVQPKAGWKYVLEKDSEGSITSITWTTEGSGLSQTEFDEFRISGKVADDAKELTWKAYQTYSDKSIVEWTGAPDADHPASVTAVSAGTGEGDGHGAAAAAPEAAADSMDSGDSSDKLPLVLSIIAVVLGAAALIAALARKKR